MALLHDDFNEDDTRKDAKLTSDYNDMQSITNLINEIIGDTKKGGDGFDKDHLLHGGFTDAEKKDRVKKNVGHLKLMVAKTDWKGSEDMTAVNKAITDGTTYVGE
jgi:hypothetical protein